jgi:DNA-binding response OmpR family regulator
MSADRDPGRKRVLVVDDEPSIRLLCALNLELAGFDVAEAPDGPSALERAAEGAYDLVLLDVMMPGMSGYDVLARLHGAEGTRALPVVFVSARAGRADVRRGLELGALDYITKPFDPVALADSVGAILDRVERGEAESFRRARLAELGAA